MQYLIRTLTDSTGRQFICYDCDAVYGEYIEKDSE